MAKSLFHVGYFANRLTPQRDFPREVAFAEAWHRENNRSTENLLEHLLPGFTEDASRVAATVIQWLGTNVGQGFLRRVAEEIEKGKGDSHAR